MPQNARSVEVLANDLPLMFAPLHGAARRGSAQSGARFAVLGWAPPNASCVGRWILVGPLAWACEAQLRLTSWPPTDEPLVVPGADGLPYQYFFVSKDGAFGYATLRLAEEGVPDSQLEPGFAVAVRRVETKQGGTPYGLTTHGFWLPMRELVPARASPFAGKQLSGALLAVAWAHKQGTPVFKQPGVRLGSATLPRLSQLDVIGETRRGGKTWLRVGAERWVRDADVRRPTSAERPPELLPSERWLDVDTTSQVLTAYEGDRPVFATLISTGKGATGTEQATPLGKHRIWVKLVSTDMANLEDVEASRFYAIEEVPWVMFFKGGYGLHGAFWHDSFGNKRSHGCVNLSPVDAYWLFTWAGPAQPPGWHAAHPTEHDLGTMVVVR
jgi:hypothetical protein